MDSWLSTAEVNSSNYQFTAVEGVEKAAEMLRLAPYKLQLAGKVSGQSPPNAL
jgi:hypothetical protein